MSSISEYDMNTFVNNYVRLSSRYYYLKENDSEQCKVEFPYGWYEDEPSLYFKWDDLNEYVEYWNDLFSELDYGSLTPEYMSKYERFYKICHDNLPQYLMAKEEPVHEECESIDVDEYSVMKYTKSKPKIAKYIRKDQLNALPEYAKRYYNGHVTTNKTIKIKVK